jgi:hypothetical protein
MLDANSPTFRQQFPNGAIVRDHLGRQVLGVVACNPETGEVITFDMGWIAKAWRKVLWAQDPYKLRRFRFGAEVIGGEILRRHGFWPAPLAIEPQQPAPPPGWDSWSSLADHVRLGCALRLKTITPSTPPP